MGFWRNQPSGLFKCDKCGLIMDVNFYYCPYCGDKKENYNDDSPLRYWHSEYYFKWRGLPWDDKWKD